MLEVNIAAHLSLWNKNTGMMHFFKFFHLYRSLLLNSEDKETTLLIRKCTISPISSFDVSGNNVQLLFATNCENVQSRRGLTDNIPSQLNFSLSGAISSDGWRLRAGKYGVKEVAGEYCHITKFWGSCVGPQSRPHSHWVKGFVH